MGTLIGISGAMVLTFVKGKDIKIGTFHFNLLHQKGAHPQVHATAGANIVMGALCALASGVSYASWLIIQVNKFFSLFNSDFLSCFSHKLLASNFLMLFKS